MIGQFLYSILISFFVFFVPIYPLILLCGVLILIDTLSGIVVAYMKNEAVTSKKMSKVLGKLLVYSVIQLLAYCIDYYILQHFIPFMLVTRIVAAGLSGIELVSLDEHLRRVNNNKGFMFYLKFFKRNIKTIKDDINDVIKK